MTNAIIGYENGFETGTVTASSDPAATPKENAFDWRLEDYWQPGAATQNWLEIDFGSAQSVDFVGFYSSDFYGMTGAELNLFSGASPAPTTSRLQENITTEGPKLFTFASVSARYWRLRLDTTGSESPKVQMLAIGQRLELQRGIRPGFMPPALAPNQKAVTNISASGMFLGRSLARAPINFTLQTNAITAAWIRTNWPGLLVHIERYPFFLLPEPDNYGDEAVIAWTRDQVEAPRYDHAAHLGLNLSLQAYR